MSVTLIGAKGLVGSAFARYFDKNNVPYVSVQRDQMQSVIGASCDLVINCAGNGHKGRANSDPAWDFRETVGSASHYVHAIDAKVFVHVSTVDVYADPGSEQTTEEMTASLSPFQSVYGFHKLLAEHCVQRFAKKALVLRLPALVGPNLRKNPIFDHFHEDKSLFIAGDSRLNIVHTDFVAEATLKLLNSGVSQGVFNLAASDSLKISDLPEISGLKNSFHEGAKENQQTYEVNTARVSNHLTLQSSADAVKAYMQDLPQ